MAGTEFVLTEIDGYDETEVYHADSLEELTEYLMQKTGKKRGEEPPVKA